MRELKKRVINTKNKYNTAIVFNNVSFAKYTAKKILPMLLIITLIDAIIRYKLYNILTLNNGLYLLSFCGFNAVVIYNIIKKLALNIEKFPFGTYIKLLSEKEHKSIYRAFNITYILFYYFLIMSPIVYVFREDVLFKFDIKFLSIIYIVSLIYAKVVLSKVLLTKRNKYFSPMKKVNLYDLDPFKAYQSKGLDSVIQHFHNNALRAKEAQEEAKNKEINAERFMKSPKTTEADWMKASYIIKETPPAEEMVDTKKVVEEINRKAAASSIKAPKQKKVSKPTFAQRGFR